MNHHDIKELFYLSPKERRGVYYLLIILMVGLSISYFVIDKYYNPIVVLSPDQIEGIQSQLDKRQIRPKEEKSNPIFKQEKFDPNTVLKEELEMFGWPQYPIKSLIAYRNNGGKFKKKEDLKKIYGITEPLYIQIEDFVDIILDEDSDPSKNTVSDVKSNKVNKEPILFDFNPNQLSVDSLLILGWSSFAANNLNKYRNNGGVIKNKEDILEIYGMTSDLFEKIEPHIIIENENIKSEESLIVRSEDTTLPTIINLNSADSITLMLLKGVGPYRANAIIKYRNRLGGFYHLNQLYEIYGLDSSTVRSIIPYLSIDKNYGRINVKEIEFKRLLAHPYTDYNMTVIIKNYFRNREQEISLESFINTVPLDSVKLNILLPYLILNEE